MTASRRGSIRASLVGSMIGAGFGIAWALWAAGAMSGGPAIAVRVVGILVGATLLGAAYILMSRAPESERGGSMFGDRRFRLIVIGEAVALFGGGAVLGATDHVDLIAPWYALIVGVHFLVLGLSFWTGFRVVGAVMIIGALVAYALWLARGGTVGTVVAGLVSAVALFASALWGVVAARRTIG